MIKTTVRVGGMSCAMCESRVNEAVRRAFPVKKVTSSRKKGATEIVSDAPLDADAMRGAIAATGYAVGGISAEPYEKKGFPLFR